MAGIPRKNPYASFLHSSFVFDRSRSVVEIPNPDLPGGEFMGHPLDYGGKLDFARPLSESVGKLKVQSYEFSDSLDTERGQTRYGKPIVKGYETAYETKLKNGKRYSSSKKRILAPAAANALRNDIAGALEDIEENARSDHSHTLARYNLPRVEPVEFPGPLNYDVFF